MYKLSGNYYSYLKGEIICHTEIFRYKFIAKFAESAFRQNIGVSNVKIEPYYGRTHGVK